MAYIQSQVFKFQIKPNYNHKIRAVLFYPKLAVIEDSCILHLIDLKNDQIEDCEVEEIVDQLLYSGLLWLILKSGNIIVMDMIRNIRIKLITNVMINHVQDIKNNLMLLSKSGEYYEIPFTMNELQMKLIENNEYTVNLNRVKLNHIKQTKYESVHGLDIHIESGKLIIKCPYTGLFEMKNYNKSIENILSWEEDLLISNRSEMFLMNVTESKIMFTFENLLSNYFPVAVSEGRLYYLVWSNEEVQVCCAWPASVSGEQENDYLDNFKHTTSQESLINQLQSLVDSMLSESNNLNITQLQELYEKISNLAFLIDTSLILCKHNILYKPLLYPLKKRVYQLEKPDLLALLSDLIIKVDMQEYIFFKNNCSYDNFNLYEKNFKELCITFISNSDLDLASICWLKYFEMDVVLAPEDILDILNAIPYNTKMGAIIIWLKNFVPTLLEQNPFHIDVLVKWTTDRIFKLEHSKYWPKIGIKFLEEILKVLETSSKIIAIRPISLDYLDVLMNHIKYILELKENYKINMLLSEISTQAPQEVALIMLRRCYTEDLETFLKDYLPAYATQHMFDIDDTLRLFIENDIASCGGHVDGIRLKILLNAFHSLTSRLECLLQVLKILDVPWHATVLEISIAAASSATKDFTVSDNDYILAKEIQNEITYCKIKIVLKKYNFPLTSTNYKLILYKLVNAPIVDMNDLKVIKSVMASVANYGNALYVSSCLQKCETRIALNYFYDLSKNEKNILIKTIIAKFQQLIGKNSQNRIVERNYLDFLKGTHCLTEIQMHDIEYLYHEKSKYNDIFEYNNQSSYHSELLTLLHQTSTSHQVREFVSNLIISNKIKSQMTIGKKPLDLCDFKDGQHLSFLVEIWKVFIKLIEKCKEEYLHELLIQFVELNTLINSTITVKNLSIVWKFHYMHLPILSTQALNDLIDLYCNQKLQNVFKSDDLNINKYDFIMFRVNTKLQATNESVSLDLLALKKKAARRLLTQIVSSQSIDEVFITSLLLVLKTDEEISNRMWVLEALKGPNESLIPTAVSYLSSPTIRRTFELDTDIVGSTISYPPHYILKTRCNINLSEITIPENTEETWDVKIILFYVLKQYTTLSLEKLLELCHALNVQYNEGLTLQLISLLSNWNLKYKIFDDELGRRQLAVEEHDSLYNTCLAIWKSIDKKNVIRDILNDFWKNGEITLYGQVISLNPYYYEVFLCIYHLIFGPSVELRNIKEYFLLNFLKDYRRKSTPKQYEFELFSIKGLFPEIGHFRLPFHLFMREDKWSNLKSEITLETYERWLPAVAMLCLDSDPQTARDMICSNALKQTMTSRRCNEDENLSDTESWNLTSREEPLLRAAHRCVKHIANMEWAGACLFYVLQGCTRGADQVAAAQLCYQFAQCWAALQPGNRAVRQMERLHASFSTRHALHKIDWACNQLVRFSNEPAQLIRGLYLHPDFIKKIARHDVNRTANEIADKSGINISSIRIQLLENILDKSKQESTNKNDVTLNTTELLTAKYILKATCPKMAAIYLSRIAFDDETDYNKAKKLRALQCLMSIVDPDTAIKVTNWERDALWPSLLELLSVVKLENINMPWIVVTFLQDKICALKQLLKSVEVNNEGLKIVAELVYRYGSREIISNTIPILLRVSLYEDLMSLLSKVSSPPDNMLYIAWRTVLLSPFQQADYPITESQRVKCLKAINLLPICPVIKDEDLIEIWKNCMRCKCLGLGCLLLPYMSTDCRKSLNELLKIDKRNLIVSVKNLQSETYLVSGALYVIENMSQRLNV